MSGKRTGRPRKFKAFMLKRNVDLYDDDLLNLQWVTKRKGETWANVFHRVLNNYKVKDSIDAAKVGDLREENDRLRTQLQTANERVKELEQNYNQLFDKVKRYMNVEEMNSK
jgi:uncharacterized protein YlxW (UPF0749 family)